MQLDKTMQLNVGGNSDFLNMLERERLESKKISKTNAVTSMLDYDIGADNVHVGPSDYVPWLTDRKWAYIRMEGSHLRRRAAEHRAEARGLGLAELGRHRDRRGAAREARAEQRRRGRARGAELVPDEVAAEADPRRRGARGDRGVHQRYHAHGGRQEDRRAARLSRWRLARVGGRRRSRRIRGLTGLHSATGGYARLPRHAVRPGRSPTTVNEHVAGLARALRSRGHVVTVLAPSNRAADLRAGRRALQLGEPTRS